MKTEKNSRLPGFPNDRYWSSWRRLLPASVLALILSITAITSGQPTIGQSNTGQAASRTQAQPGSLSAAEFSRLSRELSEEGGYFRSDNFTSNETSYLHVVDKLRQLGATGGAYLGVGPEQNFTYIAKVRPRIAFIMDIRRQAIIQHLMYKAVFHLSPTRAEFIAKLTSRPVPKEKLAALNASVTEMTAFFRQTSADDKAYAANLSEIRKMIQNDFQFPLSENDLSGLEYVYRSFCNRGLSISYQMGGMRGGGFPDLGDLIEQGDLRGKLGNFLAVTEDYEFVRELHRKHLIIPVVGDFGGRKALAAIGDYLRKHGYTVTAYYTSNVEQYLFENGVFGAFANNVRKLPLNEKSFFIRGAPNRYGHPAQMPGHRSATLLQQMMVFLKDFDEGLYNSYPTLLHTHYIAANIP
jgi:hypothetical protein